MALVVPKIAQKRLKLEEAQKPSTTSIIPSLLNGWHAMGLLKKILLNR
jgi:hypothetical protein